MSDTIETKNPPLFRQTALFPPGPMTDERLAEIERRLAVITEGPWEADGMSVYTHDGGYIAEAGDSYPRGDNNPAENMTFIAAAPVDVRDLLAEVRRLKGLGR